MKNFNTTILFVLAFTLMLSVSSFGQTAYNLPSTTLSNPQNYNDQIVTLASSTNVSASTQNSATSAQTLLWIDNELEAVISNVSGNTWNVARRYQSTGAPSTGVPNPAYPIVHQSGSVAYFGPQSQFNFNPDPVGYCNTSAISGYLPRVHVTTGHFVACPTSGPNKNQWTVVGSAGAGYASTVTGDSSQFAINPGGNTVGVCHFQYDFSVDGGAINTALIPKKNCTIPANSIITGALLDATTAIASSASGTLAIGFSGTGGAANALFAANATATGILQSVIVPQTASGFVKITTAGQAEVAIATGALTAGVVEGWIYYESANN